MDIPEQLLELLGQGHSSASAAAALGVSEGYVSQLLSGEEFRSKVRARRVESLQKFSSLDEDYYLIESKAAARLKKMMPLITKTKDLLDIIKVVNGTKRRGAIEEANSGESRVTHVIDIRMPTAILNQFIDARQVIKDQNNQIIQAGAQSLITAQPTGVQELAKEVAGKKMLEVEQKDQKEQKEYNNEQRRVPKKGALEFAGRPERLSLEDLE